MGKELSYEAAKMAFDSCELTLEDIDAVCMEKPVGTFKGV